MTVFGGGVTPGDNLLCDRPLILFMVIWGSSISQAPSGRGFTFLIGIIMIHQPVYSTFLNNS